MASSLESLPYGQPSSFVNCFEKPNIVGYMSVDVNREYHADLSELKFVTHIPEGRISLNLSHNINKAIKRTTDENVEKIDLLLKYLLDQSERIQSLPDFIMYRRTMISVFCSALGIDRSRIVASFFNGSIYLCNTVDPESDKNKYTPDHLKFCAWGYKFEQYMNADLPSLKPDIQKPVVENAEFSLFYRAKFGSHDLLYGAQIDGMLAVNGKVPDPPVNADYETNLNYLRNNSYVELKTNREIRHRKQEENFKRNKLLKCWAQCYLAGLQGLIVGYRNDHGIVNRLECFHTEDIVEYCQDVWSPRTALEFLDYFLTFVKNTLKKYAEDTLGENCDFKTVDAITLQFEIDTDRTIRFTDKCDKILPDWFMEAKMGT